MTEVRNLAIEYLNNQIDNKAFTQKCQSIYHKSVLSCERHLELEYLNALPFIHEFAYAPYSDSELKIQVADFLDIISDAKEYRYSVMIQLSPLNTKRSKLYDQYNRFDDFSIEKLRQSFQKRPANKNTLDDILYSSIYEILQKCDTTNLTELDFDSINCNQDVISSKIKEQLQRLLSYYLGLEVFLLQIHSQPHTGITYIII